MTTSPLTPAAPRRASLAGLGNMLGYLLIALGALLTVLPLYLLFVLATQDHTHIFTLPPPTWFGQQLESNYHKLLNMVPIWRLFWNSAYISIMATAGTMFFCSLAGFAFAAYDFVGKRLLFSIVLTTMMIPPILNLIPTYLVIQFIGWLETPRALWLPGLAGAFGIFLLKQYIESAIPLELVEAGRVDGATEFGIYWRIVLPLVRPALATLGIVTFIGSWNNFTGALIILKETAHKTLPLALRAISGGGTSTDVEWGSVMLGAAITVLPLLIAFIISSRQLIAGLTAGSVKS